jgi:protein arginine kinase activator
MKCDICGDKEAVIHVKQIAGEKITELHLCSDCANEKGISGEEDIIELSLSQLLTSLIDLTDQYADREDRNICSTCGTTIKDFRKNAAVGCADCYNTFSGEIESYLENTAGQVQHVGKLPEKVGTLKTLLIDKESLREKLENAIEDENYEQAAVLRDRIKIIEKRAGVEDE